MEGMNFQNQGNANLVTNNKVDTVKTKPKKTAKKKDQFTIDTDLIIKSKNMNPRDFDKQAIKKARTELLEEFKAEFTVERLLSVVAKEKNDN